MQIHACLEAKGRHKHIACIRKQHTQKSDYNIFTMIIRNIAPHVQRSLDKFLNIVDKEVQSPEQWKTFYEFITCAYAVLQTNRPGVSQLSDIFRVRGIKDPGTLAVIYAHVLYSLAIKDEKKIYGDEFNV